MAYRGSLREDMMSQDGGEKARSILVRHGGRGPIGPGMIRCDVMLSDQTRQVPIE